MLDWTCLNSMLNVRSEVPSDNFVPNFYINVIESRIIYTKIPSRNLRLSKFFI